MSPGVLRRFIIIAAFTTFAMFSFWMVMQAFLETPPGDYETRKGDILLADRKYDEAVAWFDKALAEEPHHRGAMMGRAIAFLQSERYDEAEVELSRLIDFLTNTLEPDDPTGQAVLAGAYANRGILYDRTDRYEEALADYLRSLQVDAGAVKGPNLFHRILYGTSRPATVEKRARYLAHQLSLPEDQRVMRIPELDERQRMHKP